MRPRLIATVAVLLSAALLMSGCGGSDETADGRTRITVSTNPSAQMVPLYLGVQDGIFARHGLEVEIVHQTDVAAILSGTASGQYDFGFATSVHLLNANYNGIPVRAVSTVDGRQSTDEEPEAGSSLVAGPNSGVTSPADLGGRTLGVVGLSSLNTLTVSDMAARRGVDPATIELVQMPFGQMPAALAAGDVDAAVLQSPFVSEAVDSGSSVIGKPNVEVFPDMVIGLYTTAQSKIDSDPETVQAFSDAMLEAQRYASDHVDEARATLVPQLGLTEEAAREATWNVDGDPRVTVEGLAKAQQLLRTYTGQQRELDVDTLVWPGALQGS